MKNIIDAVLGNIHQALDSAWKNANAKPPEFDHLSASEFALAEGSINDFDRQVANGYFDEDVERDYRRFLFRWGCDKQTVDSACSYMSQQAAKIVPSLRNQYRETQDKYWSATGRTDTRGVSYSSNE